MTHEETPDERAHEETGRDPRESREAGVETGGSPGDTTEKPKVLPRDKDPHPKTEDGDRARGVAADKHGPDGDAGADNSTPGSGHQYGERLPGR